MPYESINTTSQQANERMKDSLTLRTERNGMEIQSHEPLHEDMLDFVDSLKGQIAIV